MKKVSKVIILLIVVCLAFATFVACTPKEPDTPVDEKPSTIPTGCQHEFQTVGGSEYIAPTYDSEGRELRSCTKCGITTTVVLPKLERIHPEGADGIYLPLLSSYIVTKGDTLKSVKDRFFTNGWDFELSEETLVGEPTETGRAFTVVYTPTENKYQTVYGEVVLIVTAQ